MAVERRTDLSDEKLRKLALDAASDRGMDWAYYNRKEDEELDHAALARVLSEKLVTREEILEAFAGGAGLAKAVKP